MLPPPAPKPSSDHQKGRTHKMTAQTADHRDMANTLKSYLIRYIRELRPLSMDDLLATRYQKFRKMGRYLSGPEGSAAAAVS